MNRVQKEVGSLNFLSQCSVKLLFKKCTVLPNRVGREAGEGSLFSLNACHGLALCERTSFYCFAPMR